MQVKPQRTNRRLAEIDCGLVSTLSVHEIDGLAERCKVYSDLLRKRGERTPSVINWLSLNLRKESRRRKVEGAEPGLWELDKGIYAECPAELGYNLLHLFMLAGSDGVTANQTGLLTEVMRDLIHFAKARLENYSYLIEKFDYEGK